MDISKWIMEMGLSKNKVYAETAISWEKIMNYEPFFFFEGWFLACDVGGLDDGWDARNDQ